MGLVVSVIYDWKHINIYRGRDGFVITTVFGRKKPLGRSWLGVPTMS